MSITEVTDGEIQEAFEEFENLGGVIDFKLFRLSEVTDKKQAHLVTARATLEELKKDNDRYFSSIPLPPGKERDEYYKVTYNPDIENTASPIEPEIFFGPFFNLKDQRPILRGRVGRQYGSVRIYDHYFYYDTDETPDNIVSRDKLSIERHYNHRYVTKGYAQAFLEPVHFFASGKSLMELGDYFLEFNRKIFGNLSDIEVYSWGVDCSNYFDDGKEWWGSFFWTIYSPARNWYVGITASTTD